MVEDGVPTGESPRAVPRAGRDFDGSGPVPPNQAATRPSLVSAIVEAWHCANGAFSKTNSALTTGDGPG
jgi:hypothetical protein